MGMTRSNQVIAHGRAGEVSSGATLTVDTLRVHEQEFGALGIAVGRDGAIPLWSRSAVLTDRQQLVATLACDALSNRRIAEKLGVTEGTVKQHLHAIYVRLGVRSRIELMIALTKLQVGESS
jgi:DNA-binding NarL/FixJ family response regulator